MGSGIIRLHAKAAMRISLRAMRLKSDLLSYLQKKHGRISYERILSGPGIRNIYDFLRDTKGGRTGSG